MSITTWWAFWSQQVKVVTEYTRFFFLIHCLQKRLSQQFKDMAAATKRLSIGLDIAGLDVAKMGFPSPAAPSSDAPRKRSATTSFIPPESIKESKSEASMGDLYSVKEEKRGGGIKGWYKHPKKRPPLDEKVFPEEGEGDGMPPMEKWWKWKRFSH